MGSQEIQFQTSLLQPATNIFPSYLHYKMTWPFQRRSSCHEGSFPDDSNHTGQPQSWPAMEQHMAILVKIYSPK